MSQLILSRRRGTDISWSLPLYDASGPVALSALLDYEVILIYFVGSERRKWLTFKKNPSTGELPIIAAATSIMKVILPHDKTSTAPLTTLHAEVKVKKSDSSGQYPSNENWIVVLNSATGKDLHPICRMEAAAI